MKYTVLWTPSAERELAALWVNSQDRDAITAATERIDRLLGRNPASLGESREGSVRIMFIEPLGIEFEIHEQDRKVFVLTVWRSRKA